ncbi:MAG TPA: M20/M25/M40 family metallo-hydrolase [Vicinamibacteria bacterium]|nr:M20/M25/M40 family metallo-hydrolase [Vicinamibacteria bacterium]
MSELVRYIRQLVDIPSVSGDEGQLARKLERDLSARGFEVELQEVAPERFNVYARDPAVPPKIIFCTHMDTVPPFFASSEDEEYIYGRGSCDAKGILAAMVFAVSRMRQEGRGEVGLLFVVGEEVDSAGARAANALPVETSYVVVGEPTENRMASGHKGGFKFRLTVEGKACHSAYPHLGDSAIDRLIDLLLEIRRADWGRSDRLGEATVNVGTISGGLAANVLAPEAGADVFVRVVGRASEVQAKLDTILRGHRGARYEVVSSSDAVTCETRPGFDVAPVAFGTDIPSLEAFGKPLLLGPGSIHDAHTSKERIGKEEAEDAVEYYQRLALELLSETAQ